ncbi:MAG: hemerythrin domain-containing protein, partial [Thermodesulfobacteriota bacterium]
EKTYSPPIKRLVDEHLLIKKWLALIPEVIKNIDVTSREGRKVVAEGIDFISSYADKFHHAKEEAILFTYFDGQAEIIRAMLSDHETGRRHVRAMREALDKEDKDAVIQHLQAYRDLLADHIKKEDEILFPWMDGNLSETDKNAIAGEFDKAERAMDAELPAKGATFIADLEKIHPPPEIISDI